MNTDLNLQTARWRGVKRDYGSAEVARLSG